MMLQRVKNFLKEMKGQGMAEYGLILMLVAVACIAIFISLGGKITDAITSVVDSL